MASFEIQVDDRQVSDALQQLIERVQDATPAMEDIARALRNATEDAFQNQRSPFGDAWQDLTEETKERREEAGHWPGPILQVSGQLAASIATEAGADWASIGVGKEYAAIHQFGGLTTMAPGPAGIPARPYLPIDQAGNLPESLRQEILEILAGFLEP